MNLSDILNLTAELQALTLFSKQIDGGGTLQGVIVNLDDEYPETGVDYEEDRPIFPIPPDSVLHDDILKLITDYVEFRIVNIRTALQETTSVTIDPAVFSPEYEIEEDGEPEDDEEIEDDESE